MSLYKSLCVSIMGLKTLIYFEFVIFLFVHVDRVYSGVEVDCNDVLSNVAPCFDTLEQRINATLQSVYNKTYVPAGNGRDSDYVYLAVRDEFCRTSNEATVDCVLTNLTACPGVTVEEAQFLYSDYIPQNLNPYNTTALLCSHLRTQGCEVRDRMFEDCYDDILPEFLINVGTDIPLSRVCLEKYRSNLTCMHESYRDCENVTQQDNLPFFDQFKVDVYLDKWLLFESADQLCSCTSKSTCQLNLDSILEEYSDRSLSKTVFDEYNRAIGFGEAMCRGKEDAVCAYTNPFERLCNELAAYSDRQASYEQHYLFVQEVCTDVESQEFTNNRRCILNELSRELASCKNILPRDARNLTCVEMEYLYKCFYVILDQICGNLTTAVFEIFEEYYELPDCEIDTSHGHRIECLSMDLCNVVAFFCILLVKFKDSQLNAMN